MLGPGTLTVADLINDLAVVLTALGRHADAERAFRESFDRHVALFGESHWRVRNVARNIGLVVALQQRYQEALPWMDRAVAIRRTPSTPRILSWKGSARSARGLCSSWAGVRRRSTP